MGHSGVTGGVAPLKVGLLQTFGVSAADFFLALSFLACSKKKVPAKDVGVMWEEMEMVWHIGRSPSQTATLIRLKDKFQFSGLGGLYKQIKMQAQSGESKFVFEEKIYVTK